MPKITKADINARLLEVGLTDSQISSLSGANKILAWAELRKEREAEDAGPLNERYVRSQEAIAAADTKYVASLK